MARSKSKMTVMAGSNAAQSAVTEPGNQKEIAALAYELWMQRGCPIGSPEVDWFRAEEELKRQKELVAVA